MPTTMVLLGDAHLVQRRNHVLVTSHEGILSTSLPLIKAGHPKYTEPPLPGLPATKANDLCGLASIAGLEGQKATSVSASF